MTRPNLLLGFQPSLFPRDIKFLRRWQSSSRRTDSTRATSLIVMMARPDVRFIDVGANLTSAEFRGEYFGRSNHEADLDVVCERARQAGVFRMIVTGSSLEDSRAALDLVQERPNLYSTLGIHPTRCSEVVDEAQALESLRNVWQNSSAQKKIVAIGECGLDYDRTQFCDISQQKRGFEMQFRLAEETKLPMFLHNRNTSGEFVEIVQRNRHRFSGGVVHSYTGTLDEAQTLIDLGLYIGINGCSLKTEENLQVVRKIPLNKILLETDCPYCEIRETHASNSMVRTRWTALDRKKYVKDHLVKGRSEPCMIRQVAEVVAAVQDVSLDQVAETTFNNTMNLFFPSEAASMGDSPYLMCCASWQEEKDDENVEE